MAELFDDQFKAVLRHRLNKIADYQNEGIGSPPRFDPLIVDLDRNKYAVVGGMQGENVDPFSRYHFQSTMPNRPEPRTSRYPQDRNSQVVQAAIYHRADDAEQKARAAYAEQFMKMRDAGISRQASDEAEDILFPKSHQLDTTPTNYENFVAQQAPEHQPYFSRLGELARRRTMADEVLSTSQGQVADHIGRLRATLSDANAPIEAKQFANRRLMRLERMAKLREGGLGRVFGIGAAAATIGSVIGVDKALGSSVEDAYGLQ